MRLLKTLTYCSILAVTPVYGQTLPSVDQGSVNLSSGELSDEAVTAILRSYVEKGEAKGIVVGILEPNGQQRFISYGSAGVDTPSLGPDSVFEIGSLSKTYTAAVLADLAVKGLVALDDPVSKYLPSSVRVPSRGGKNITLRHLATHMSGLPRMPDDHTPKDPANPYSSYTKKNLYEFLNRHELGRDPGGKYEYSNLGAGLLGHALARAAGVVDFKILVERRLLKPLRMTSTRYGRNKLMTKGHGQNGQEVPHWDVEALSGAGGLNSSARDMLRYVDAQVGPARTALERSMRVAHEPNIIDAEKGLVSGLAWVIGKRNGRTILSHGGGTAGYSSFVFIEPGQNTGVVVLSNQGGFKGADNIALAILFPRRKASGDSNGQSR